MLIDEIINKLTQIRSDYEMRTDRKPNLSVYMQRTFFYKILDEIGKNAAVRPDCIHNREVMDLFAKNSTILGYDIHLVLGDHPDYVINQELTKDDMLTTEPYLSRYVAEYRYSVLNTRCVAKPEDG